MIVQPITEISECNNTHTHKRQASMHLVEFKPTIPAREQPQSHALDHTSRWDQLYASAYCFKLSKWMILKLLYMVFAVQNNNINSKKNNQNIRKYHNRFNAPMYRSMDKLKHHFPYLPYWP
jgi:hypothetical protein